ncbi:MAG: hypothetical protein HRU19_33065 [Pseudobacteriovorax sp.]|nr:hypothetical protein [Pseudobacteriovorax sp.]
MSTNFESRNYSTRDSLAILGMSYSTFQKWIKVRGIKSTKKGWWAKNDIDTMLEWIRNYNSLLKGPENLTLEALKQMSNNRHNNNIVVHITENGINKLFHIKGNLAIVPVKDGTEEAYLEKLSELL